eukprot:5611519-Amphidinium_carterae.2
MDTIHAALPSRRRQHHSRRGAPFGALITRGSDRRRPVKVYPFPLGASTDVLMPLGVGRSVIRFCHHNHVGVQFHHPVKMELVGRSVHKTQRLSRAYFLSSELKK